MSHALNLEQHLSNRYHVVQLSTLAGTIDLSSAGDYVFRVYPSSDIGSRYIATTAIRRFKAKRIAIFYPNNPFGVASKKFVSEVVKDAGANLVAVETFNDGDRDFRTQLTKIIKAKPNVLLCSAYYEEGAQILVQAKQLGLKAPILGEDGWFGPIANIAGECLDNLYFANVAFGPEFKNNHLMQDFISAFTQRFNKVPNSYSAAGHAAVFVVKKAIQDSGYSGEEIKNSLHKMDIETSFGRIKFGQSNGDNTGAIYDLFQLNQRNEPILVSK